MGLALAQSVVCPGVGHFGEGLGGHVMGCFGLVVGSHSSINLIVVQDLGLRVEHLVTGRAVDLGFAGGRKAACAMLDMADFRRFLSTAIRAKYKTVPFSV